MAAGTPEEIAAVEDSYTGRVPPRPRHAREGAGQTPQRAAGSGVRGKRSVAAPV